MKWPALRDFSLSWYRGLNVCWPSRSLSMEGRNSRLFVGLVLPSPVFIGRPYRVALHIQPPPPDIRCTSSDALSTLLRVRRLYGDSVLSGSRGVVSGVGGFEIRYTSSFEPLEGELPVRNGT